MLMITGTHNFQVVEIRLMEPVTVSITKTLEMLSQLIKVYTMLAPTKPAIYAKNMCIFHAIVKVQPLNTLHVTR